ncbi:MAG: hypothetical protein JXD18_01670 [Anaerolineae bacterium]|nr:hypothetical protein [Anaerolineae bacterium]
MTRNQWLVVILLGIGDAIVLGLLAFMMAIGMPTPSRGEAVSIISPTPAESPTPTSVPTWTPTPIPTDTPIPSPTPLPPTPAPRPLNVNENIMLNEIEQRVVTLRGLDVLRPIPRWALTREQFADRLETAFQDESITAQAEAAARVLVVLDLMDANEDMVELLADVLGEQVAGYYDVQEQTIYLVAEEDLNQVENRMTFVHEAGHALQDQHFDLAALGLSMTDHATFYDDPTGAVRALIEGDAELVQLQYIEEYLAEPEILALQFSGVQPGQARIATAPRGVREAILFPYVYGLDFVTALYDRRGWSSVNAAYANPPSSTEQILHPERYLSADAPLTVTLPGLTDTLGADWHLIYDATLGEFFLRLHLERWLSAAQAAPAAEGWGGDTCAVYYNETTDQTAMLLRIRWDTPEDAVQFVLTYSIWAEARFAHRADTLEEGLACWQAIDAVCMAWEEQTVTIVRGPDRDTVDRAIAAAQAAGP